MITLGTHESRQCLRLAGTLFLGGFLLGRFLLGRFTLGALAFATLLSGFLLRRLALGALALGRLASALGRRLTTLVLSALGSARRTTLAVLHC